ncbi:MAG: exo-beta-1,3-glucanase (GH17 family) [Cyclobacteriaceae bacterium]|jgi:exo-beta-1,3-glucanase (GH17 family)
MNIVELLNIVPERAICYSGFRERQSPVTGVFPSYAEIREDLMIIQRHWKYIRLYDCDLLAERVLEIIQKDNCDLKVMLGAHIGAEMNNFNCPWGGTYSEEILAENKERNTSRIKKLIQLANLYPHIIFSLSAGNEATVEWTDHYVSVERVIEYVKMIKASASQPVTFCENFIPWQGKLKNLAEEVDFISIHTYPVWEYKHVHEAIDYTIENYKSVAEKYPHKPVVITEAGWATNSNGRGIKPENVSEAYQAIYYNDLMDWSQKEGILTFVFEAFDEPWKGSDEPMEPEKHWGFFTVDRKPKLVMEKIFQELQ